MDTAKKDAPPQTGASPDAPASSARPPAGAVAGSHRLNAEEQKRHQAFLAFVRAKEEAWATMSPAERAEAEAAWEAAVTNINDARAGHRKVFVG